MIVLTSRPTIPPEQLPDGAVFDNLGGDLLIRLIAATGEVDIRLARYLGGEWIWHPVGTLSWDSAVTDADATDASKRAGRRFERVICDDLRSHWALVKVGGAGVVVSAEMYSAKIGAR